MPRFERAWLLPTWVLLGVARFAVLFVAFPRLARRLGRRSAAACVPVLDAAQQARAASIGRTVRRAARYTPWTSNCFPQAIAARLLLGWHGVPYALLFGLAQETAVDGRRMKAHAWVAAGRIHVTGGAGFERFTVVGCFVAPSLVPGARK